MVSHFAHWCSCIRLGKERGKISLVLFITSFNKCLHFVANFISVFSWCESVLKIVCWFESIIRSFECVHWMELAQFPPHKSSSPPGMILYFLSTVTFHSIVLCLGKYSFSEPFLSWFLFVLPPSNFTLSWMKGISISSQKRPLKICSF